MARTTIKELKKRGLAQTNTRERAEFDETYAPAALAIRVGEQSRAAREAPVSVTATWRSEWVRVKPRLRVWM